MRLSPPLEKLSGAQNCGHCVLGEGLAGLKNYFVFAAFLFLSPALTCVKHDQLVLVELLTPFTETP